jgi:hypothetical protein
MNVVFEVDGVRYNHIPAEKTADLAASWLRHVLCRDFPGASTTTHSSRSGGQASNKERA